MELYFKGGKERIKLLFVNIGSYFLMIITSQRSQISLCLNCYYITVHSTLLKSVLAALVALKGNLFPIDKDGMRNGSQTEPRPLRRQMRIGLKRKVLQSDFRYAAAVSCDWGKKRKKKLKIYFGLELRQSQVLIPLKQQNQVFVHGALY